MWDTELRSRLLVSGAVAGFLVGTPYCRLFAWSAIRKKDSIPATHLVPRCRLWRREFAWVIFKLDPSAGLRLTGHEEPDLCAILYQPMSKTAVEPMTTDNRRLKPAIGIRRIRLKPGRNAHAWNE